VDWETDEGRRLLAANPVRGYEMPTEKNPKRPLATQDQLEALLGVADQVTMEVVPKHPLHPEYGIETKKPKKLAQVQGYLQELLLLVNGTGRRIGSVRTLTFADLRLDEKPWGAIRWAADRDKIGRETTTPIGPDVRAVLDRILEERPGAGTVPLFPAPEDPAQPIDKYFAGKLLTRGIALAKRKAKREGRRLEIPPRWGYHSFRRKFATELKKNPDKDVADLGGWKDLNTLRQIYQMADHDSMVQALTSRLELREAKG
jgi:integrase